MKDLKEISHFLGLDIRRDIENQVTEISQMGYIENILARFGMENCKPIATPMDANTNWDTKKVQPTEHPYRELLGCLQYLELSSRPYINAAVNILSKYQSRADVHWSGLKPILRYLKGTKATKIVYKKRQEEPILQGYADADFGNDVGNRFLDMFSKFLAIWFRGQRNVNLQ